MGEDGLGFIHRFAPTDQPEEERTLLLLHGTGGSEDDLLPLGSHLLPGAALLSARGKVLERGMPRFFRRLAEGVFDLEDLRLRTHELADFVTSASRVYPFDPQRVIAVGYSNGANIAASMLLLRPDVLASAMLFHPMVPFTPPSPPPLRRKQIFIGAGRSDELVPQEQTESLSHLLKAAGADVTVHWEESGHPLNRGEVEAARVWLQNDSSRNESVKNP
jgi:predicted esterase